MMFWLGFYAGLGSASTAALIVWAVISHADAYREEAEQFSDLDLGEAQR